MSVTEKSIRYCSPVIVLAALLVLPQKAPAQVLSALCSDDSDKRIIVINHPDKSSSELVKSMGEGGGLALGSAKTWALSNTMESEQALSILRSVYPSIATTEAAGALMTVMRSAPFRAGTLAVFAYGAYLVIDGIFGDSKHSPEETKQTISTDLSSLRGLNLNNMTPCPAPNTRTKPGFDTTPWWQSIKSLNPPNPSANTVSGPDTFSGHWPKANTTTSPTPDTSSLRRSYLRNSPKVNTTTSPAIDTSTWPRPHSLNPSTSNTTSTTAPGASSWHWPKPHMIEAPTADTSALSRSYSPNSRKPEMTTAAAHDALPSFHVWDIHPNGEAKPAFTLRCDAQCKATLDNLFNRKASAPTAPSQ